MANKDLFKSKRAWRASPSSNCVNEAGGDAYLMSRAAQLAQLISTGCMSNTFYASAEDQLDKVIKFASHELDAKYIAQLAVFAREQGYMKDTPALLCAILTTRGPEGRRYLKMIFNKVIDNGRMLRNFVQIIRSGRVGRRSFGSFPKSLIRSWFDSRDDGQLFKNSIGNDPSMADVIKMIHPKPKTASREALYAYLIGKKHNPDLLPVIVQNFESFKKGAPLDALEVLPMPAVPFEMLTALPLTAKHWKELAQNMSWTQLRMNLNTLMRHGVFEDRWLVATLAEKLSNRELIKHARVFPYQLLSAFMHADPGLPMLLHEALQTALDISLENIPEVNGRVAVFPDHSGSMDSPVTGYQRTGRDSKVTCKMAAALVAAAYLRKNPDALVLPFAEDVTKITLNPRDSVMTNAAKLAVLPSGGTNCSAPLKYIVKHGEPVDVAIFVSDNESWIGSQPGWWSSSPTEVLRAWDKVRQTNKGARMVCVDIQPNTTVQAPDREEILNIGGFSDRVFDIVSLFAKGQLSGGHWVEQIQKIEI